MNKVSVSRQEAAEMLGLSLRRLDELLASEAIDSGYDGSRRLVSVESIEAYFKSLPKERVTT